jgi:hypothetical protein
MLLLEYGVLGAIAGTVGALGAIVLSWAIARFALRSAVAADAGADGVRHSRDAVFVAIVGIAASLTSFVTSRWRRCGVNSTHGTITS